jgi:hypothetical protein
MSLAIWFGLWFVLIESYYKRNTQITKNENKIAAETQDFNVENPSNTEEKKSQMLASKISLYRQCLQTLWITL